MDESLPPFSVAMLAGGGGRRLGGTEKYRIVVDGDEIGSRTIVAALLAGANDVLAIGGDVDVLGDQGWRWAADRWPGEGPLGGLITALTEAQHDIVVIVGCDQPYLDPESLVALVARLTWGDSDATEAVLTEIDGVATMTHSAWRRSTLAVLLASFDAGERSVRRLLDRLNVVLVVASDPTTVVDIDTPDDLREHGGSLS
jgi:molybdenum cofactor guanylyltransferase